MTDYLLNQESYIKDGGDHLDDTVDALTSLSATVWTGISADNFTHSSQKGVAVASNPNQFENGRGVVIQAVRASEFVKQKQHHGQEESAAVASIEKNVL